ncbi:chain-length determining protein [Croceicoccus sediminis]|uniref:chain-length determining protein n=1 Tax=Croceicoccus sediminis TaxID=2571150 RepID=UPI0011845BD3|nr:chain-length determining protein [Croceicoccus sediminis]
MSESHIIVQNTDLSNSGPTDLASALIDGAGGNSADQLLLRDYLLSVGMMQKLEDELDIREHWSQSWIDPISRLWFGYTDEDLYEYYLDRITVEYDEYDGVIVITAEAFDAETAHAITSTMVRDGGEFMNRMAQDLALEQVRFLETQVERLGDRAMAERQAVTSYQNRNGLVSPEQSAQALTAIIAQLERQRSELKIELSSMGAYLVSDHPSLVEIRQQIAAIDSQIAQERRRLSGGEQLNTKVEQFQQLQLKAEFAQNLYQNALTALEKGRIEGGRTIKAMSVIQPPTLPEEPTRPSRFYNTALFILVVVMLAGLFHLVVAIVRDHKD